VVEEVGPIDPEWIRALDAALDSLGPHRRKPGAL
jgi:hypothetical protein